MTKFLLMSLLSCLALFLLGCKNVPEENCQVSESGQNQEATTDCANSEDPLPQEPGPNPEPLPEPGPDVPPEASLFKTNTSFTNFTSADQVKVEKALNIIKTLIRSSEFRDRILNFEYEGQNKFVDSDKSPEEIYQSLIDGSEDLSQGIDHEMDLNLELYYSSSSTVGYTYPDVLTIWMNTKFFNVYTPAEVAGNILHEWTHKLGYDHASRYSVARDSSVPYALGYIVEELGAELE